MPSILDIILRGAKIEEPEVKPDPEPEPKPAPPSWRVRMVMDNGQSFNWACDTEEEALKIKGQLLLGGPTGLSQVGRHDWYRVTHISAITIRKY